MNKKTPTLTLVSVLLMLIFVRTVEAALASASFIVTADLLILIGLGFLIAGSVGFLIHPSPLVLFLSLAGVVIIVLGLWFN